jgi:hypothetical protein
MKERREECRKKKQRNRIGEGRMEVKGRRK